MATSSNQPVGMTSPCLSVGHPARRWKESGSLRTPNSVGMEISPRWTDGQAVTSRVEARYTWHMTHDTIARTIDPCTNARFTYMYCTGTKVPIRDTAGCTLHTSTGPCQSLSLSRESRLHWHLSWKRGKGKTGHDRIAQHKGQDKSQASAVTIRNCSDGRK